MASATDLVASAWAKAITLMASASFTPLSVSAATVDHDRNHHGQAMIMNQVVEDDSQPVRVVPAILNHDEGSGRSGNILARHIDPYPALVRPIEARINFAVHRIHRELMEGSLRHAIPYGQLRGV